MKNLMQFFGPWTDGFDSLYNQQLKRFACIFLWIEWAAGSILYILILHSTLFMCNRYIFKSLICQVMNNHIILLKGVLKIHSRIL